MKNVKKEPSTLEKINAVYIILYFIFLIIFLNSSFTWPKAIAVTIGLFVALILLIIETLNENKKPF
jgi:hypothetical protein